MRYWVYKDAQILGPLSKEDFAQGRLRADTLVCGEDASGKREMDWRCAEDIPELSGLYLTREQAPSVVDLLGSDESLLEHLRFEILGSEAEVPQEDWLSGVFRPTALKANSHDVSAELVASQERVRELTEKLEDLTRRFESELSRKAPETAVARVSTPVPDLPPAPTPAIKTPAAVPEPPPFLVLPPLSSGAPEPAVAAPLPSPAPSPEPVAEKTAGQGVKLGAPKSFLSVHRETPPPLEEVPKADIPPGLPEPSVPEAPEQAASNKNVLKLPPQTLKKGVKLGAPKSFVSVRRTPASASVPAPSPAAPAALPTPAPAPVPVLPTPPPAPPPPVSTPVPMPQELPPMPTFQPIPAAAAPLNLEPPPIPAMAPIPVAAPPATMAYSGFFSSPPQEIVAPQPAPVPKAKPAGEELLAQPAKPQEASVSSELRPKKGERKFLVISLLLAVGLIAAGLLFFRDSNSIQSAVDMGDNQAPLGTAAVEGEPAPSAPLPPPAAPVESLQPSAPLPSPAPAAVETVQSLPAPIPEPAPASVAAPAPEVGVQDERTAAIDLVKGFPLDGDRGTVGRWLQYSFTASPGFNEKWDAGAVEGSTYLVQYTAQGSGKNLRSAITYLFEANVALRIVMGKNTAARRLLAGSEVPVKPAPKRARKPRPRRVVSAPAAAPPKQLPQLPLPSDSDLLPPAEEGDSFRSDMVRPGL